MTISYDELAALAGHHAMADTACPLCGPGRRSPANRKRRVLRIWHTEPGFASYNCARCRERGWARQNQVIAASRSRGVREQTGLRPLAQLAPHRTADLDNAKRSKVALAIWQSSKPAQGTPVETYLASRGIHLTPSDALRFHAGLKHRSAGIWPAMVALVTNGADGTPLAIHRTFLARDGAGKAPIDPAKMMLGPCRGGVVRLADAGEILMIGEGVETCLAAMQARGLPAWAALSTSGVLALELPDEVQDVIVLADGDEAGKAAARGAALRWKREGRRARIAHPPQGLDFNDMLLGKAPRSEGGL
jgi:putative DNA primase/helicase